MSNPRRYFETHVKANHADWCNEPLDERKAMNAAVSANQMADHMYHYLSENDNSQLLGARNPGEYRGALAEIEPDFALVRDVAEAHKHVQIGRSDAQVRSADRTNVQPSRYGEMRYGEGVYSASQFVVELEDGDKRALSALMTKAIEMWSAQLDAAGL